MCFGGRKFRVSHANGDPHVADVLLVGRGGTAVPCPFWPASVQLHIVCICTRETRWVLDNSPKERAFKSKLQLRVPKKSFWDKMVNINHVGGVAWPKKSWKWVLDSPWVWALTLRIWVLTLKVWKSCSWCLFSPFFFHFWHAQVFYRAAPATAPFPSLHQG